MAFHHIAKQNFLMSQSNILKANFTSHAKAPKPKVKTWSYQANLPKLPVSPLGPTMEKYLKSVRPLVTDQEFEHTKKVVAEFVKAGGKGEMFHKLLVERSNNSKTHWLQEWWDSWAYMSVRDPIMLNVNYYFHYDIYKPNTETQTKRAAQLTSAALGFKRLLDTEELQPDMAKDTPLDMTAYEWMFNATRIPHPKEDYVQRYDNKTSKHIIVMRHGKFYRFDVVNADGSFLSTEDIEKQFKKVIELSDEDMKKKGPEPSLGVLTTDDRTNWFNAREKFLQVSPKNKESLEGLQSGIFMVCLDDTKPEKIDEIGRGLWHGDGRNRFFDKSFQLIVFANGVCGLNGEHSKLDGMPVKRLSDYMLFEHKPTQQANAASLPSPSKIDFVFNDEMKTIIKDASARCDKFIGSFGHRVLQWPHYGSNFIKSNKMSPDAYIQMALQWTYFSIHGNLVATYESAQTKKYGYGRTEVGRSVTIDSKNWVQAMANPKATPQEKVDLLRKACSAHGEYMKEACDGFGCDRFLLGVRLTCQEKGWEMPDVVKDPAFARSSHWAISTSQLSSEGFYVGFGNVYDDGYGVCYSIRDNYITLTMSSNNRADNKTNINVFYDKLQETLKEMHKVCELAKTPQAKL